MLQDQLAIAVRVLTLQYVKQRAKAFDKCNMVDNQWLQCMHMQ